MNMKIFVAVLSVLLFSARSEAALLVFNTRAAFDAAIASELKTTESFQAGLTPSNTFAPSLTFSPLLTVTESTVSGGTKDVRNYVLPGSSPGSFQPATLGNLGVWISVTTTPRSTLDLVFSQKTFFAGFDLTTNNGSVITISTDTSLVQSFGAQTTNVPKFIGVMTSDKSAFGKLSILTDRSASVGVDYLTFYQAPEPGSIAVFAGLGFAGLVRSIRRRKS